MIDTAAEPEFIEIIGARENNLKGIDVSIPRDRLVVITGLSGSGKSSLAFDTIYAEGQRRYIETFSSYARLIQCGKESDGKKTGTSGAKIGNVHLKWAFSEAAVCFLQHNPPGRNYLQRLRRKHSKGKALSVLAAKLGRATYFVLKQQTTFDMNRFLAN